MFASYHLPPQQFHHAHASLYRPTTHSPSFHQPRHTLQTHSSPPPPKSTGNSVVPTALTPHKKNTARFSQWCGCVPLMGYVDKSKNTLRARGVCSRISHPSVFPPQQEPFFTHVYRPCIIPKTPIFLYPPRRE